MLRGAPFVNPHSASGFPVGGAARERVIGWIDLHRAAASGHVSRERNPFS
jgi:hypothetical protein